MWEYGWLPLGGTAFVLVLVNLMRAAMRKHGGWQVLLFASLSCGVLAVLCALRMVNSWLWKGDWAAIEDVVPAMSMVWTWALCLGIALNLLALWLHLRGENARKEKANDGKS